MKKIGLLGGTFNPIHLGHIALGEQAYQEFNLDKVIFMSSGKSYLKSNIDMPSKEERYEMTCLAVSDYPYFEASDIELKREGNTYTFETIKELKSIYNDADIYFIIGADTLFSMENWVNPEYIFNNSIIISAVRDKYVAKDLLNKIDDLSKRYNASIELLHLKPIDISSSKIREDILNKDTREQALLNIPEKVKNYIIKNHLYNL